MDKVLVVGGANTDIVGAPDARLRARDSNPGHVTHAAGGVARNIAENLARLGVQTVLVTAFGDDAHGAMRRQECASLGIDVGRGVLTPGIPGSVYLALLDDTGDLAAAVSDMRALEAMGPEMMDDALEGIGELGALVLEANLRGDTLARIRQIEPQAPLFLECVSVAKARRLTPLLPSAWAVHANIAEAEAVCGRKFDRSVVGALEAARDLVVSGVRCAYVTVGERGTAWASRSSAGTFAAPHGQVVNATGAGDAFMAGVVSATLAGHEAREVAAYATACAAITLRTERTVAEELTRSRAIAEMREVL